jgi:hypothetical protein
VGGSRAPKGTPYKKKRKRKKEEMVIATIPDVGRRWQQWHLFLWFSQLEIYKFEISCLLHELILKKM